MGATDLDVAVVSWPSEAGRRDSLARQGRARLLVVEDGHDPPPAWDVLEDWVRAGDDPIEVFVRRERLRHHQAQRAPAVLDEDGLLRRGDRWVAVSPAERRLLEPLLARAGAPVGRAELLEAVAPGVIVDDRRALDRMVRRVRLRVAPLGVTVPVVRGFGYVLETALLPD
ncbi:MAG TPA: winged helix-turn-helix domain-containing protein [Acidimicrobiales bacterium]|nr:winged helix-turn-helix domain-containing protein [Acidimicrobiales bacterium]